MTGPKIEYKTLSGGPSKAYLNDDTEDVCRLGMDKYTDEAVLVRWDGEVWSEVDLSTLPLGLSKPVRPMPTREQILRAIGGELTAEGMVGYALDQKLADAVLALINGSES